MSENVLEKIKENSVYPDDLMADIARSRLGKTLLVSALIHVAFIGVTSIGFIRLCARYDTLDPKAAIAAEQKAAKEKEKEEAATTAGNAGAQTTSGTQSTGNAETPPAQPADAGENGGTGQSPIEQKLEEKDTNYPPASDVGFGDVDSLE